MKIRFLALSMTAFAAGCAMSPAQLSQQSSGDLCIEAAQTVTTGQPVWIGGRSATEQSLAMALKQRGETCQPWKTYIAMAQQRVQYQQREKMLKQEQLQQSLASWAAIESANQPRTLGTTPTPTVQQSQTTCSRNAFGQVVCNSQPY